MSHRLTRCAETVLHEGWCQRWTLGQHSFVHRSAGGFRSEHYSVEPIALAAARSDAGKTPAGRYPHMRTSQRLGVAVAPDEAQCEIKIHGIRWLRAQS